MRQRPRALAAATRPARAPAIPRVTVRCYAELNDFLAPRQRQRDIEVEALAGAPLRHLIATLGVPHTEVELILVNGRSVDLEAPIAPGDRVSLYPLFEALDVAPALRLRPAPLRQTRFLVDAHLGKLARYLRLLGFDTRFENDVGDPALVRLAQAEHRILLTRDRALLMHRALTHGCYLRAAPAWAQVEYLVRRLDLLGSLRPFTRCMCCNALLTPIAQAEVAQGLPPRVRAGFDRFWRCSGCARVYWQGTHYQRLAERIRALQAAGRCADDPSA